MCVSQGGQATCQCRRGYLLAEDMKSCEDIDECDESRSTCSQGCVNTDGSFACICMDGYQLGTDGKTCYRIEMEVIENCGSNSGGCEHICTNTPSGKICSCFVGYTLERNGVTCADINECDDHRNGGCEQICSNSEGSFECSCQVGYRLSTDGRRCFVAPVKLPHALVMPKTSMPSPRLPKTPKTLPTSRLEVKRYPRLNFRATLYPLVEDIPLRHQEFQEPQIKIGV